MRGARWEVEAATEGWLSRSMVLKSAYNYVIFYTYCRLGPNQVPKVLSVPLRKVGDGVWASCPPTGVVQREAG